MAPPPPPPTVRKSMVVTPDGMMNAQVPAVPKVLSLSPLPYDVVGEHAASHSAWRVIFAVGVKVSPTR